MSRIAIFLPSLDGGGAERVMVTLANGFAARGHEVDLVLCRAEGPYLPEVSAFVRIVDLDRRHVRKAIAPLARYLRQVRPDTMLSAMNYANIIAIIAHRIARVSSKLVVSERTSLAGMRDDKYGKIFQILMKFLYPLADGVIAVSKDIASEQISEIGVHKNLVTAIPNPIDLELVETLSQYRPKHDWLGNPKHPVIIAVGRLNRSKDYPLLIEAFSKLRAGRDVRLIILGDGGLRKDLEKDVAERGLSASVFLAGFQSNPYGWMAASQIYVMSSRCEGFPNSLVQAMACGTKVVSTDCPTGPREILEGGRWGRLVEPGNVEDLHDAMVMALDDPEYPIGLQRVKDFSSDKVISSYLKALGIPDPQDFARIDLAKAV